MKKTSEAVVAQRYFVKKLFLEISQNSQEHTCARVYVTKKQALAQVFSCEFCEISKNTFSYRTPPPIVASETLMNIIKKLYFDFLYHKLVY